MRSLPDPVRDGRVVGYCESLAAALSESLFFVGLSGRISVFGTLGAEGVAGNWRNLF